MKNIIRKVSKNPFFNHFSNIELKTRPLESIKENQKD